MSIQKKVALAAQGEYPFAIARMASGWAMLGEVQPIHGYCVLFSDPVVQGFHGLTEAGRAQWGIDCGRIGDALMDVLGAVRINYETWGNVDLSLHTHLSPRYANEAEDLKLLTPRQAYDWNAAKPIDPFSVETKKLIAEIRKSLAARS